MVFKLHTSSKRALFATQKKRRELSIVDPICTLFDTLVKPIIMYGSEIWGADLASQEAEPGQNLRKEIERLHLDALKWILSLRKQVTGTFVRAEFGLLPIAFSVAKALLNYYIRIFELSSNRILKLAFQESMEPSSKGFHLGVHRSLWLFSLST